MTTAKPPARYSAMESARSGDFATPELHHPSGHDPEEFVMELCKPLDVRTAERIPYGLKLSGNAALDGFRERRSL